MVGTGVTVPVPVSSLRLRGSPMATTERSSRRMPQNNGPAMPAITLHQPWASLIAHGIKKVETRSWPPPHSIIGERIAIHAGRTVVLAPGRETVAAIADIYGTGQWHRGIPRGAVVATATLARAQKVSYLRDGIAYGEPCGQAIPVDPYGDFTPGRWLWLLTDIRAIEPVPARGRQRLWYWTPPAP